MAEASLDFSASNRPLIKTIEDYADAFIHGEEVAVAALCGRILRGTKSSDFDTLTDDPARKIVMLMGSDGLEMLPGRSGYGMLTAIGYTHQHIRHKVEQGNEFKLAVFAESTDTRPATWPNVLALVGEVYPDAGYGLLTNRRDLQKVSFDAIQEAAGYNFAQVDANGPDDERFMTHERYLRSGMGLIATRAFLYNTVHLRELYSGDGFTYSPDGEQSLQEYATLNKRLDDIGEYALLNFPPIDLP